MSDPTDATGEAERRLDEMAEESFPGSDPPSTWAGPPEPESASESATEHGNAPQAEPDTLPEPDAPDRDPARQQTTHPVADGPE